MLTAAEICGQRFLKWEFCDLESPLVPLNYIPVTWAWEKRVVYIYRDFLSSFVAKTSLVVAKKNLVTKSIVATKFAHWLN